MDKYYIEAPFRDLVQNMFKSGVDFGLLVPSTDDWELPLPESTPSDYMIILIRNWTKEVSHYTTDGVYIRTAFGDYENTKYFPYTEIRGVTDMTMQPLFLKPYDTTAPTIEVPKGLSLKDVMHDEEGQKRSMAALKKHNPPKGKE